MTDPMPRTDADQPPTHVYQSARQAARNALDEEPELTNPGNLVRHRMVDAAVEATWQAAVEHLSARFAAVERDRDTFRGVARSNRRHNAVQAELLERVTAFAEEMRGYCSYHGQSAMYADRLLAHLAAPTEAERVPAGVKPDDMDWAVKVTRRDGTTRLRHEDDPLLSQASAEQIAENARRHPTVVDARPVCRDVWHGPWATPHSPTEPTPEEKP